MVEATAATGATAGVKVGAGGNGAGANEIWRAAMKAVLVFSSSAVIPSLQMRRTTASELSFIVVLPLTQFLNAAVTIVIYCSLSDRMNG